MTAAHTAIHRNRRHCPTGLALLLGLAVLTALAGCLPHADEAPPSAQAVEATPAATDAPASQPALVVQVQGHLAALGYAPGPRDGVIGPQTAAAIEAYQRDRQLTPDGRITAGLLADLEANLADEAARSPVKAPADVPKPRPEEVAMAPLRKAPPAPRYLPGTRYLYANGEVQEVVAVDGEEVRWRSDDGESAIRNRNFMLPPLAWSDGEISYHSTVDRTPDALWQKSADGNAVFTVITKRRDGGGPESVIESRTQWSCRLAAAERITVIAGSFDTFKMICDRLAADGTPDLERSWSYAPALGHFVRRHDRILNGQDGLTDSSVASEAPLELVAIQPAYLDWPPAARGGLDRAMQHVLEELPDGETLDWRSSAVPGEIALTAGTRLALEGRTHCRRLEQTWANGDTTWRFPRLACRAGDGSWHFRGEAKTGQRLAENATPTAIQSAEQP